MSRIAKALGGLLIALAAAQPAQAADPRYVVASVADSGVLAIDLETLEIRGPVRSVDGYIALAAAGQDGMVLAAMTTEVDCVRRTWRFTAIVHYDAEGRPLRKRQLDDWAPAHPGTNAGNTVAVACGEVEAMDIVLPADPVEIRQRLLRVIDEQNAPSDEIET